MKKIILIIFMTFCFSNNVDDLIDKGYEAMSSNPPRLGEAEYYFKRALSIDPEEEYSLRMLARIKIGTAEYDECIAYILEANDKFGTVPDDIYYLGICYLLEADKTGNRNYSDLAKEQFENYIYASENDIKILSEDPHYTPFFQYSLYAGSYEKLGLCYNFNNQTNFYSDEAISNFSKAVELEPGRSISLVHLAQHNITLLIFMNNNDDEQAFRNTMTKVNHYLGQLKLYGYDKEYNQVKSYLNKMRFQY